MSEHKTSFLRVDAMIACEVNEEQIGEVIFQYSHHCHLYQKNGLAHKQSTPSQIKLIKLDVVETLRD